VSALRALGWRVRARWWTVAAATLTVFGLYQALILGILVAGLGGAPNSSSTGAGIPSSARPSGASS